MSNPRQLLLIQNKKLGLLISDARKASRRSVEECADAIGVSPDLFQQFEKGASSPSLPQLELLALFLNIPLEHFWGRRTISASITPDSLPDKERMFHLRNRVIGANLRLTRTGANLSFSEVQEKTGIPEEKLKQYELGETAVPTPDLEVLCAALDIPIERFYDQHGPIGRWRSQQENIQKFLDLSPELQAFVSKPVNRPYVELAIRLSDLSTEKLRAVAEVLLEITF